MSPLGSWRVKKVIVTNNNCCISSPTLAGWSILLNSVVSYLSCDMSSHILCNIAIMSADSQSSADTSSVQFSQAEAEVYDRQIRLWGVEAQKRLRSARVLVSGVCGLGAEVIKNLVLAGVKSVTILDHEPYDPLSVPGAGFLLYHGEPGENRAAAAVMRCQELNPMVSVEAHQERLDTKSADFFSQFDIVCITNSPKSELIRVNEICRTLKIKFLCGDTFGFYAFMASDLLAHEYNEEVLRVPAESSEGLAMKRRKIESERFVETHEEVFPPISTIFDYSWKDLTNKQVSRLSNSLFILLALIEFKERKNHGPTHESIEGDTRELDEICTQLEKKHHLARTGKTFIPRGFVKYTPLDLSPVCAILGGVIAQEVIKGLSGKDQPLNNFFVYNGIDGHAIVEKIC